MANEDKRIIELPASESILNDDWIGKDSASQGTTKIQLSLLKQLFGGGNFAGEWIAGHSYQFESYVTHEGKLYHNISGGNIQDSTWNASHWSEITVSGELIHLTSGIAPWFRTTVSYRVNDYVIYNNRLYRCSAYHNAGSWNDSHFVAVDMGEELNWVRGLLYSNLAPTFSTGTYNVGDYVVNGSYLYQCIKPHTGGWNAADFRQVKVGDMLEEIEDNFAGEWVANTAYSKDAYVIHENRLYHNISGASITQSTWSASSWEEITFSGELKKMVANFAMTFNSSTSYHVGQFVVHNNTFYRCNTPHTGAWNWEHFSLTNVSDIVETIMRDFAPLFSTSTDYAVGDYVTRNLYLYKCTTAHPAGEWNASHFTSVKVMDVIKEKVADVQIAGQTTADENHISDLTSLAIEGTASGEIASFSDGSNLPMKSFICNIDAVQDLHGYDAPWVGGAGKNKFFVNESVTSSDCIDSANATTGIISVADISTAKWSVPYIGYTDVISGKTYTISGGLLKYGRIGGSTEASGYPNDSNVPDVDIGTTIHSAITNAAASRTFMANTTQRIYWYYCTDTGLANHQAFNVQPVVVEGSSAGTWSPYSNICPISGHTGINAWVRGKNLLDISNAVNAINVVDSVEADGTIHFKDVTARWSNTHVGKIYVVKGQTYVISASNIQYGRFGLSTSPTVYPKDSTFPNITIHESGASPSWVIGRTPTTRHFDSNFTGYIYLFYCSDANYDDYHATFTTQIQIELGETATGYVPYNTNSQTIQVSWQTEAGEVFGGYVDLVSGELTVLYELKRADLLTWQKNSSDVSSYLYFTRSLVNAIDIDKRNTTKCNAAKTMTTYPVSEDGCYVNTTGVLYLNFLDAIGTNNLTSFNNFLTTENITLLVPLATPITYQLTPQQIKSLLGNNNAWCSTGDVDVKYNKDATIVINSLIARIEALENA